ncbi:hypothetical protein HYY69_01395 [Candidatus Woesearchaeota archaeon]|nr:hypothetical protein [Candidatus Woesearchaeota archaeon]
MKALILSSNALKQSSNLDKQTKQTPIALTPIVDQPLINYLIEKIEELSAVDTIYIITNNKFYHDFVDWKETILSSKHIEIVNDMTNTPEEMCGAIGDVQFAITEKKITDDLLIIGGDNLFDFSLVEMQDYFNDKKATVLGVIDLQVKEKIANKYGVVETDKENKIIGFEEKPKSPATTLTAMCLYFLNSKDISSVALFLQHHPAGSNGDFIKYLAEQTPVYVFPFTDGWLGINDSNELEKARELYTHKRMII